MGLLSSSYSPAELRLFKLLPKDRKPISSTDLMVKFYDGRRMPLHGRTAMNVSLKRLQDKLQRNKEPFRLVRTKRHGLQPIMWYVRSL